MRLSAVPEVIVACPNGLKYIGPGLRGTSYPGEPSKTFSLTPKAERVSGFHSQSRHSRPNCFRMFSGSPNDQRSFAP
jgi:hypothetical protein